MSWNRVHRAIQEDVTLLRLMANIQRGMPDFGLELDKDPHVVDRFLCYRDRIVITAALRGQVLAE